MNATSTKAFLHLERPVVFFDLETTGFDMERDRIVELCAIKMHPDGSQEEVHHLINPGRPIPHEASQVHGITDEKVKDAPSFASLSEALGSFFRGCDLAGFNIYQFDMPFLLQEFRRSQAEPFNRDEVKVIDVCTLFHKRFKRDLSSAFRYYCGADHTEAHSARADVLATMRVLEQQLVLYNDLHPSANAIHEHLFPLAQVDVAGKFVKNSQNVICFAFGKYNGEPATNQPDYLRWMLDRDFSEDTKTVIRKILEGC